MSSSKNAKDCKARRDKKREAGLKEVRGMWYPSDCHKGIKALTKRYYGFYKVKQDLMDKIDRFVEKVL